MEEDSVSIIKEKNVVSPPVENMKPGDKCSVKVRGKTYPARCLEIGEYPLIMLRNHFRILLLILIYQQCNNIHCLGNKSELVETEKQFSMEEISIELILGGRDGEDQGDDRQKQQKRAHKGEHICVLAFRELYIVKFMIM